MKTLSDVG